VAPVLLSQNLTAKDSQETVMKPFGSMMHLRVSHAAYAHFPLAIHKKALLPTLSTGRCKKLGARAERQDRNQHR
jgi:hypothetical protein